MKKPLFFLAALALLSCCASAGFTMNLATKSQTLSGGEVRINFSITNSGDETAYDVMLEPVLPEGFASRSFYLNVLPPNRPVNGSFNVKMLPSIPDGKYPVVLVLHYEDRNSYPFSVIFPESITKGRSTAAKVLVSMPSAEITGEAPVDFNLKVFNQDSKGHNVTLTLYLPKELGAEVKTRTLEVEAQSSATLPNRVWSMGALYDSNYLVLASASYIEEGKAYVHMAQGRVSIVKPAGFKIGGNVFMDFQWILAAVVLAAILVLAYLTVREKSKNKDEGKEGKEGKKGKKGGRGGRR